MCMQGWGRRWTSLHRRSSWASPPPQEHKNHLILERKSLVRVSRRISHLRRPLRKGFWNPRGCPVQTQLRSLGRQADAAQQVLEARVGMQRVEDRGHVNEDEEFGVLLVCLSEHFEDAIILAEPDIDSREMERRNIVLLRFSSQLCQNPFRLRLFPRHRIGIGERRERSPIVAGKFDCLLKFSDSFTIVPILPIGGAKYKVRISRPGRRATIVPRPTSCMS
jgi:hypothetical protein